MAQIPFTLQEIFQNLFIWANGLQILCHKLLVDLNFKICLTFRLKGKLYFNKIHKWKKKGDNSYKNNIFITIKTKNLF